MTMYFHGHYLNYMHLFHTLWGKGQVKESCLIISQVSIIICWFISSQARYSWGISWWCEGDVVPIQGRCQSPAAARLCWFRREELRALLTNSALSDINLAAWNQQWFTPKKMTSATNQDFSKKHFLRCVLPATHVLHLKYLHPTFLMKVWK